METYVEEVCEFRGRLNELILSEALEIPEFSDYLIHPEGFVISLKANKPHVLMPAKTGYKRGYLFVVLRSGGKSYPKYLHRLVAEVFLENTNAYPEVNHKDVNTFNNHKDNLEWCTPRYNSNYAHLHGNAKRGTQCPWSKHSEEIIRELCRLLEGGVRNCDIARTLRVNQKLVAKVKKRRQWVSVSKQYNF